MDVMSRRRIGIGAKGVINAESLEHQLVGFSANVIISPTASAKRIMTNSALLKRVRTELTHHVCHMSHSEAV